MTTVGPACRMPPLMDLRGLDVLVTGGTGSLGRRVVRRLLSGEYGRPASVTVFSRDEAKQHDMRLCYLERREATDEVIYQASREMLRFRIGDIRDGDAVRSAVAGADLVIHAAALKQVPTCEYFPTEAVKTNVGGAQNLVRAIAATGRVRAVVAVSTDKACKPINVMGMTKALMERTLATANREIPGTRFVCVRHGNVIGSRGSVVPLFRDQIERGGPVTITTEPMTRFLLTIEQAADGVFAALRSALPGEIYVPRSPAARVVDVARALIGSREVAIMFTGIRPGEKVHEILVSEEERPRTVARDGYLVIASALAERDPDVEPCPLAAEYSSSDVTLDQSGICRLLESAGAEEAPL